MCVHDTNFLGLDTSIDPHFHSTIAAVAAAAVLHNFYPQFSLLFETLNTPMNVFMFLEREYSVQHLYAYVHIWMYAAAVVVAVVCSFTSQFVCWSMCLGCFGFILWISNKFHHRTNTHDVHAHDESMSLSHCVCLVVHIKMHNLMHNLFVFYFYKHIKSDFSKDYEIIKKLIRHSSERKYIQFSKFSIFHIVAIE